MGVIEWGEYKKSLNKGEKRMKVIRFLLLKIYELFVKFIKGFRICLLSKNYIYISRIITISSIALGIVLETKYISYNQKVLSDTILAVENARVMFDKEFL
jgi:hypothetical protein